MDFFKSLFDNSLPYIWIAASVVGSVIVLAIVIRFFTAGRTNRSGALVGLRGKGDLDHQGKNKIVIEYYKMFFFVFRRWSGTISYDLTFENLFVSYEVKRECGERIIALDSIYSTGVYKQKRRIWLLIIAIIFALASILNVIAALLELSQILYSVLGGILAVIFILFWFFQKRAIGFSILFGGSGDVGSRFLTSTKKSEQLIVEYLAKISKAANKRREELSSKSLLSTLNSQKALISSIKDGLQEQGYLPHNDMFGENLMSKNIHSYNNNPSQNVGEIHTYNNALQDNNAQNNNTQDSDLQNNHKKNNS